MPAMSSAMASGTVPSNEKNVTRTGRVFCNMKMTKAINRTAATQIPTQTAPARERGVFAVGPVAPASEWLRTDGRSSLPSDPSVSNHPARLQAHRDWEALNPNDGPFLTQVLPINKRRLETSTTSAPLLGVRLLDHS